MWTSGRGNVGRLALTVTSTVRGPGTASATDLCEFVLRSLKAPAVL